MEAIASLINLPVLISSLIGFLASQVMESTARQRWIFRFIQFLPLMLAGLSGMYLWHKSFNKKRLLRLITVVSLVLMVYLLNLKSSTGSLTGVERVEWGLFGMFLAVVFILCGSLYSSRDAAAGR